MSVVSQLLKELVTIKFSTWITQCANQNRRHVQECFIIKYLFPHQRTYKSMLDLKITRETNIHTWFCVSALWQCVKPVRHSGQDFLGSIVDQNHVKQDQSKQMIPETRTHNNIDNVITSKWSEPPSQPASLRTEGHRWSLRHDRRPISRSIPDIHRAILLKTMTCEQDSRLEWNKLSKVSCDIPGWCCQNKMLAERKNICSISANILKKKEEEIKVLPSTHFSKKCDVPKNKYWELTALVSYSIKRGKEILSLTRTRNNKTISSCNVLDTQSKTAK